MISLLPEIIYELLFDAPIDIFINLIQTNSIFLDILTEKDIKKIKGNSRIRVTRIIDYYFDEDYKLSLTIPKIIEIAFILPNNYLHGKYCIVYDNEIVIKGCFRNNLRSGNWYYYINKKISIEGQYKNNQKSGWWYYFHNNSKVSSYGRYENGSKVGYWTLYSYYGYLGTEFMNDIVDDIQFTYLKYWDDNGVSHEGHMINQEREGIWKTYVNGYTEQYYVNGNLIY